MKKIIFLLMVLICIATVYGLDLEISEIYPNPIGKDKGNESEFIEIHNYGNLSISLRGIKLRNNSNRTIELSDFYDEINAYEYLAFYPSFNLRNTNERIRLIYGTDILEEFEYSASIEGMSWTKIDFDWFIGKKTPRIPNFKNITIVEYITKDCDLNQSNFKEETLIKTEKKSKIIYISKNLKHKRLGIYFLTITFVFFTFVFISEKWKTNKLGQE